MITDIIVEGEIVENSRFRALFSNRMTFGTVVGMDLEITKMPMGIIGPYMMRN